MRKAIAVVLLTLVFAIGLVAVLELATPQTDAASGCWQVCEPTPSGGLCCNTCCQTSSGIVCTDRACP